MNHETIHQWAVIGAGPAGLASVGLLIESGVAPQDILFIDPAFQVGDFGQYWGEVHSNTTVKLFLSFLREIKGFSFHQCPRRFAIESLPEDGYCQLAQVKEPLQWISDQLCHTVHTIKGYVTQLAIQQGHWHIQVAQQTCHAHKIILATGSTPKTLSYHGVEEISLYTALKPSLLNQQVNPDDCIAVFGSSHSSMIILKNLLDAGVNKVVNFYLSPHRYALKMDGWILYDNTGLKASTAEWVREHIAKNLDPRITRYHSNEQNIQQFMPQCNKAIYPIGFKPRTPEVLNINLEQYDKTNGIIAPGLFGAGIAFPRLKTDPFGNQELNVGLYKFMNDIRAVLPIWMRYSI